MWLQNFELPWDLALGTISLLVFIYAFLLLNSKVKDLQETNSRLREGLDAVLRKQNEK